MQKKYLSMVCLAALSVGAMAQTDSTEIDRTVYVTRDFQPTVESAGKISVKPQIFEPTLEAHDPTYSTYSSPLVLDYTMNKLDFSVLNFRQPQPYRGYLEAGVGHVNSLLQFNYRITDADMQTSARKKKPAANDLYLDLHLLHRGQWGVKSLSESCLGFDINKTFSRAELYVGAEAGHDFFTRYGVYYRDSAAIASLEPEIGEAGALGVHRYKEIDKALRQQVWTVNTVVGVRSLPGQDIKYAVQTGYEAFIVPDVATEHQVHTMAMLEWKSNFHHVGAEFDLQDRLYSRVDTTLLTHTNHRIHIEPYYAYEGKKVHLHAGVNLDFSAGRGKAYGLSPNVGIEYAITRNWLAAYATLTGHYEANGVWGEYRENRYVMPHHLFTDTLSSEYVPADIEVGLKLRPYATLAINIHAGYKAQIDKHTFIYEQMALAGDAHLQHSGVYSYALQDASVWKVGADLHYHFRDILNINLSGNYYAARAISPITLPNVEMHDPAAANYGNFSTGRTYYDAPSWTVDFRVDGKINQKWSLYSDNHFAGGRKALVYTVESPNAAQPGFPDGALQTVKMRPMLDLNLGVKYEVDKWLSVYAQLNNYLAWTDKLSYSTFYGYEAMRANCMVGVSWIF